MAVRVSEAAAEVIRRSLEQGGYDPAEVGVRLRFVGGALRPRFAPAPEPTDVVVESAGVRVFVEQRVADAGPEVTVDVSQEHETLVVSPEPTP